MVKRSENIFFNKELAPSIFIYDHDIFFIANKLRAALVLLSRISSQAYLSSLRCPIILGFSSNVLRHPILRCLISKLK